VLGRGNVKHALHAARQCLTAQVSYTLKLIGAALLLWIAVQLLIPEDEGEGHGGGGTSLAAAIKTILLADLEGQPQQFDGDDRQANPHHHRGAAAPAPSAMPWRSGSGKKPGIPPPSTPSLRTPGSQASNSNWGQEGLGRSLTQ
jgi:hypothetical protein